MTSEPKFDRSRMHRDISQRDFSGPSVKLNREESQVSISTSQSHDRYRAESSGGPRGLCCGLRSLASLLAGAVLLAVAICAKSVKDEFTPFYRTIVCGAHVIEDHSESTSASKIRGSATMSYPCENNNPYSVTLAESAVGTIFMGQVDALEAIGTIVMVESVLGANSRNVVRLLLSVSLEGSAASDLLERFFIGSQNIYIDLPFTVDVAFAALGPRISYKLPMRKKCGFQLDVDVEPELRSQFGFVWCGETYEDVYIQPLDNLTGSLFTTFPLSDVTLQKIAFDRDASLGIVLCVSTIASVWFLLLAAKLVFQSGAGRRKPATMPRSLVDSDEETETFLNYDDSKLTASFQSDSFHELSTLNEDSEPGPRLELDRTW